MEHTPPAIDPTPERIQESAPFDPDAWLANHPPTEVLPPPDTSGWRVVPATVSDACGYTIEDYDVASEGFVREGENDLAMQAAARAAQMRQWLMSRQSGSN